VGEGEVGWLGMNKGGNCGSGEKREELRKESSGMERY
jgi:hypothetical protein